MAEENTANNNEGAVDASEETAEAAPAEETPKEEANEAPNDEANTDAEEASDEADEVEVPEKFKPIVDAIESMTVLELNELVKLLEKKYGVAAVAVAAAPGAGGDAGAEKTEFNVKLESDGGSKIPVMKAVKNLLGLGLKEAKELVESAPTVIKEGVSKEEAEKIKEEIEAAGGKVVIE